MFAPGLVSLVMAIVMSAPETVPDPSQLAQTVQRRAAPVAAPAASKPRRVMSWVPPYETAKTLNALKTLQGGAGPRHALTHLGLQFWTPTTSGAGLRYSAEGNAGDATVQRFVYWAHHNGIKAYLCVYNFNDSTQQWDWAWAKKAFTGNNRASFIAALVFTVERFGLDGVDIDFEGDDPQGTTGYYNGDRGAYVAFLQALRGALNAAGKELSVDAFPFIYNAPNSGWWASIFPYVDALTSMGYADLGRNAPSWQSYRWQVKHAGTFARKLQIGLPSDVGAWQGNNAAQQTAWFLLPEAGRSGVAIWDAQFKAPAWRQAAVWRNLQVLRTGQPQSTAVARNSGIVSVTPAPLGNR
jgi:hypothetical protein